MGRIENLVTAIKDLSPEEHRTVLNALGVHQQHDPITLHDDLTIDDYAKWETQLSHREYILCVAYLQNGLNQTKAAEVAGMHKGSASHVFNSNSSVKQFIGLHIQRLGMEAPEMIFHLSRIVRLRKADFVDSTSDKPKLSIKQALRSGAFELVKGLEFNEKNQSWKIQFEDQLKALDILTKCAGLQKQIRFEGDIADMARQAGMSETDIQKYREKIDNQAHQLAEKIRSGQFVEIVVGDE
jgi:hypothetical protein